MSAEIEAILAAHVGLEAESIGRRSIELAVRARMRACALAEANAYLARLTGDRGELAALLEEIVVPETWFFRDAEPFRFLAKLAVSHVTAHPGRSFRVLSAPCSTGEEPYSIAIALAEAGLRAHQMVVDAVDISPLLLARARAAVYPASSFRGDLGGLRERCFRRTPGGEWQLDAEMQRLVHFHQGNLVQGDFLPGQPPYQAVFCRNLLIYLTKEGRAKVIEAVHARLAEGGVVVLGHAEALDRLDARFRPAATAAAFVYERVSAKPGSARATQPLFGAPAPTLPAPRRRSHPPPAPSATPAPSVQAPPAISALTRATKLAGLGRLDEAAALCDEHLRSAGPDAAAYFLLGTIKQASGDPGVAVTCFERALYLEPAHYEALVHLALLLDQRGERSAAAQLRRRADRAQPGGSR